MTITKIDQAKKRKERVNIFLNDKFWISLDKDQLIKLDIFKSKDIDNEEKLKIEKESLRGKLIDKTLKFITIRPRSINEVFIYLTLRNELPKDQAEGIVNELISKRFLDDLEFSRWFIGNRNEFGFNGINKIKAELFAKKVSSEIIEEALKGFDLKYDEALKINDYINKNIGKIRAKNKLELKQKLIARLLARGFSYDNIKKIVDKS